MLGLGLGTARPVALKPAGDLHLARSTSRPTRARRRRGPLSSLSARFWGLYDREPRPSFRLHVHGSKLARVYQSLQIFCGVLGGRSQSRRTLRTDDSLFSRAPVRQSPGRTGRPIPTQGPAGRQCTYWRPRNTGFRCFPGMRIHVQQPSGTARLCQRSWFSET